MPAGPQFPLWLDEREDLGWRVPGLAAGWAVPRGGPPAQVPVLRVGRPGLEGRVVSRPPDELGDAVGKGLRTRSLLQLQPLSRVCQPPCPGGLGQRCPWGRGREALRSHLGGEQCPPEDRNGRRREGVKGRAPGSSGSAGGEEEGVDPTQPLSRAQHRPLLPSPLDPGRHLRPSFPAPPRSPALPAAWDPS